MCEEARVRGSGWEPRFARRCSDDPMRLEYDIASCCSQAQEREEGVREDEELGKETGVP